MDVIIAPSECKKLLRVRLPSPDDGKGVDYFYDEDNIALHEPVVYTEEHRFWFVDNLLCQKGHYNMMTKVDPLYMFIPLVYSFAGDKFRSLDDICEEYKVNFITNAPKSDQPEKKYDSIQHALSPMIDWSSICDIKEVDDEIFMRFSKPRTLAWLLKKHDRLMSTLKDRLGPKSSKATLMSLATDLIGKYIPQWLVDDLREEVRNKHLMNSATRTS